jgi:hypothetical protein
MFSLSINQAMALGNGNRRRGEVIAMVEAVESGDLLGAAFELVGNDLGKLPGVITPAEGVEPIEVLHALRNPRLCEFTEVPGSAAPDESKDESESELASVENTDAEPEAPAPAKPTKAAKPRKPRK